MTLLRRRNYAFNLFEFQGMKIQIHITFPLILVWAVIQYGLFSDNGWIGGIYGVYATLVLFILVLFHELGHAMVAKRYGVEVRSIVLFPFGGVAMLNRLPKSPKEEFFVAAAGPAVNFVVFVIMTFTGRLGGYDLDPQRFSQMLMGLQRWSPVALFHYVYVSNIIIGLFNLIPAMPLDGGRIVRSFLARFLSPGAADRILLGFGILTTAILGAFGLLAADLLLLIMAVVILSGAGLEFRSASMRNRLHGFRVEQAMATPVEVIAPATRLEVVVDKILNSPHTAFAVVNADHEYIGLVTMSTVARAMREGDAQAPASDYMLVDIPLLGQDETIYRAYDLLIQSGHSVLPVVEEGRVLGLLSHSQIMKVMQFGLIEES
jgi:Zn-dependent protease/predicted transcriptional regulator